jgi:hypothetical protein
MDISSKLKVGLALSRSALPLSFSAVSQAEPAMVVTTIRTQDGAAVTDLNRTVVLRYERNGLITHPARSFMWKFSPAEPLN